MISNLNSEIIEIFDALEKDISRDLRIAQREQDLRRTEHLHNRRKLISLAKNKLRIKPLKESEDTIHGRKGPKSWSNPTSPHYRVWLTTRTIVLNTCVRNPDVPVSELAARSGLDYSTFHRYYNQLKEDGAI